MDTEQVSNRTVPLVRYLRAHGHPHTPIVLAEGTPTPGDWLANSVTGDWSNSKNDALRTAFDSLAPMDQNLYYVSAEKLFRYKLTRLVNPTVCGVHPGDLGQYEISNFYVSFLSQILNKTSVSSYVTDLI